jgi:hypothetical protein
MPGLVLRTHPADPNPRRVWTNPGAPDSSVVLLTPSTVCTARLGPEETLAAVKALSGGDSPPVALGRTLREVPLVGLLEAHADLRARSVRLVQTEGLHSVETRATFATAADLDEFLTDLRGRLDAGAFDHRRTSRGLAFACGVILTLIFAVVGLTVAAAMAAQPNPAIVKRPETFVERMFDLLGQQGIVIIGAALTIVLAGALLLRLRAEPDAVSLVKRL